LLLLPQLFDFMPLALEKTLLLFGWAWFVNLYNFMDGADGLATSEAIALGLGLSIVVPAFAPIGLVLAAAATGFLRVNGPPAKVFMGDVSSTWLGYIIAGLFLLAAVDDTVNVIWPLATLPLVFAMDTTTTLIRRILQGHKPWEPHKTFWFHRYLAFGHTHAQLIARVAALNLILFLTSWLAYTLAYPMVGFFIGVLVLYAVACYIRAREKARRSGR
jgi:Fuc2NAc and GlcNAc transferase